MKDGKKFWDRMARMYAPIQEKSNARLYQAVTEHTLPYLSPDTKVLELACGSGQLTRPLCEKAGSWEASDYSEKMIREAQSRCPASVRFSVADITALPHPEASFDLVLIGNALHILPDPVRALAEIRRVLRPGGILLAPTFVYEGKVNRFRMNVTKLLGFPSVNEWKQADLAAVVEQAGFRIFENVLLPGDPLPEAFLAAEK